MGVSFAQFGRVLAVLGTDKDFYMPGEPVRMFFYVTNISSQPFTLVFPTTQRYDFSVTGVTGEAWRWSHDRLFAQVTERISVQPGELLAYSEVWPQVDNNGLRIRPGIYRVTAWSSFAGHERAFWPSTWIRIGV